MRQSLCIKGVTYVRSYLGHKVVVEALLGKLDTELRVDKAAEMANKVLGVADKRPVGRQVDMEGFGCRQEDTPSPFYFLLF